MKLSIDLLHILDLFLILYVFTPFFIQDISITTGKIVPILARGMERIMNLSIIYS